MLIQSVLQRVKPHKVNKARTKEDDRCTHTWYVMQSNICVLNTWNNRLRLYWQQKSSGHITQPSVIKECENVQEFFCRYKMNTRWTQDGAVSPEVGSINGAQRGNITELYRVLLKHQERWFCTSCEGKHVKQQKWFMVNLFLEVHATSSNPETWTCARKNRLELVRSMCVVAHRCPWTCICVDTSTSMSDSKDLHVC